MIFAVVACTLLGILVHDFVLVKVGDADGESLILNVVLPIVVAIIAEVWLWLLLGGR